MYLITIINDNVETVINEVSANTPNRVSGTIKQGINVINSFTFTILPSNSGYNLIEPFKTLVTVLNTKTDKYEFTGRVLSASSSMDNNGLISKTFVCESELAYLLDTYQSYEEIHDISVRGYLKKLIRVHNANTDSTKQFTVGNVNVIDNNDSLYRYVAYDSTKKNIDDDLINKLGGELQIRHENGIRYLDYLTEIGKICTTEIRLAKNLKDITQDINVNGYCNRLIVLGTKLKTTGSEGDEVDTEERLTIESVNNGLTYIDDTESIEKYGIIQGQIIFDDVTEAKNLLKKGQKHLLNQRIFISNKVNALDLSFIGIDIDSFEVGNYYPLVHEILGINDTIRIVEKSISIDNPHTSTITLGDLEKDIKKYSINAKKEYEEARGIAEKANKKAAQVENYTINEIYRVDNRVNQVTVDTNNKFTDINKELNSLRNELNDMKKEDDYLFDIRNKELNTYKINLQLHDVTVMQSFDIDINRNEIYTVQLKKGTSSDLVVTKLNSNNEIVGNMELLNFGYGANMAIEESGSSIYIWIESDSVLDSSNKGYGTKISRIKFENGKSYTNTGGSTFELLKNHTNLSPSLDKINNKLCIRSRYNGKIFFTVFNLNSVMSNNPIQIAQIEIPTGIMEELPLQGHDIYKEYIYLYEGVGTSGTESSTAYVTTFDLKGNIKYRSLVRGFETLDYREAEGIKIKQINSSTHELYIGFASGEAGVRKANIYKYIDV